jgi:hypothetical protein
MRRPVPKNLDLHGNSPDNCSLVLLPVDVSMIWIFQRQFSALEGGSVLGNEHLAAEEALQGNGNSLRLRER